MGARHKSAVLVDMDILATMEDFIQGLKTEIFTLLGVLIGGLISYMSTSKAAKIAQKAQLRNELMVIAKEMGGLLRVSQEKTHTVRSLLPYYSDSTNYQKDMEKAISSADRAALQLSRFHQTNRLFLPKNVDTLFSKLVSLDIKLLLIDGKHLIHSNREQWIEIYTERDNINNELVDALRNLVGSDSI